MNRDFKGIWIPREIWLIKGLNPVYRIFLAEIDSLDTGQGCWAGNEHFATLFGLSRNRCSEILTMLEKKGYTKSLEVEIAGEKKRSISLKIAVEKSTGLSRFRQEQSRFRQEQSRFRQPHNKDEKYNEKYIERGTRAFEFLQECFPGRLEQEFYMKYKSSIPDMEKFVSDFNDTVDVEELGFSDRVLFGRLGKYARNWVANGHKMDKQKNEPSIAQQLGPKIDYGNSKG